MFVYLQRVDDFVNLGRVAYIEFRKGEGKLLWAGDTAMDITEARVYYDPARPKPEVTYFDTSARDLWQACRGMAVVY